MVTPKRGKAWLRVRAKLVEFARHYEATRKDTQTKSEHEAEVDAWTHAFLDAAIGLNSATATPAGRPSEPRREGE